ncbi:hypothetical protein ACFSOZ_32145 [Mesorhizobium newzealandense]|uniref:Secreted protein n=1 Tax=Mesorhizobium newzealandense TaxID=1300302 RepID=A0ABW4UJD4_9HYPH
MIAFSRRFWNLASVMSDLAAGATGAAVGGVGVGEGGCVAVWARAAAVCKLKATMIIERLIMLGVSGLGVADGLCRHHASTVKRRDERNPSVANADPFARWDERLCAAPPPLSPQPRYPSR